MSTQTHTPGPWHAVKNEIFWEIRTVDINWQGDQIGDLCASNFIGHPEGDRDSPIAEANARLIAAAPDLLEALEKLCALADGGDVACWVEEFDQARSAIAKATEQTS